MNKSALEAFKFCHKETMVFTQKLISGGCDTPKRNKLQETQATCHMQEQIWSEVTFTLSFYSFAYIFCLYLVFVDESVMILVNGMCTRFLDM